MNNRSNVRDGLYTLAMMIIFTLLFTSCASESKIMYKQQVKNKISYNTWDVDADNSISKSELYNGIYHSLNLNNDSHLNKEEWKESDYFLSEYRSAHYGHFNKWDSNEDKKISRQEFKDCLTKNKLYAAWDIDQNGKLNNAELSNGIFDTYDINDDATLSSYEAESWKEAAL